MAYNGNEVPLINEFYSQLADYENNRVICSSEGQIKVLNCEPNILFEVLSLIDGIRSFDEIESKLSNKYLLVEIREFLSTLLDEKILIVPSFSNMNNSIPSILVISDDEFWIKSNKYKSISIKDFMSDSKLLKFDIAIDISTLSTYEDILTLNQKLYKIDKKFVIIRCNGENIAAGPLIIPGNSGCYECLVSMELKSLNKN